MSLPCPPEVVCITKDLPTGVSEDLVRPATLGELEYLQRTPRELQSCSNNR